jgi:hypothetical protein
MLVGCFPNAKTEDTEIFGRSLVQYVTETQPSLSDLEATRHKLIKTLVFRPSIAEILWALAATKRERLECADRIEYLVNNPKPQYSIGVQRPRPQPTSKPSNATLDWIEERQAAYSAESQDDDPNNRDIPF